MSYEERKSASNFRTVLDIGMGIFYVALGGYVFIMQSFGSIVIPSFLAWLLGGLMMIGGAARFSRGYKVVFPKKKKTGSTDA